MSIDFIKRLLLFIGLLAVQVLVLNHIHLFGCAIPLLYVYFVISFRRGYPRWAILVWSFLLGLCGDIFANTPGMGAGAMTLVGLLQPYLLELFMQQDSDDTFQPAITTMGLARYALFALMLTFVFCIAIFTVEAFTFFDWLQWSLNIVASTALTLILVLVVDNLRRLGADDK